MLNVWTTIKDVWGSLAPHEKTAVKIAGISAATFVAVLSCTIGAKAAVGDETQVRFACKSKAAVEAQVNAVLEDKAYARVKIMMRADVERGECGYLPAPVTVTIVSEGPETIYVDDNNNTMGVKVVGIQAPGGTTTFWTAVLRKFSGD